MCDEERIGLDARSSDYLDGVEDMALYISSVYGSISQEELGKRLSKLLMSINDIKVARFIQDNDLEG